METIIARNIPLGQLFKLMRVQTGNVTDDVIGSVYTHLLYDYELFADVKDSEHFECFWAVSASRTALRINEREINEWAELMRTQENERSLKYRIIVNDGLFTMALLSY